MPKTKRLFRKADLKIGPFDESDYLTSHARILGYLNEILASGNPGDAGEAAVIQHALGAAARAHGMSKVAKATGLSRENLYRSLSGEHKAHFSTILGVIAALGLELEFKTKKKQAAQKPARQKVRDAA